MKSPPCIVVVTGGSGFLGQHIVQLLQERAEHVTEIRVLDVKPYVNNLGSENKKPVRQFIGEITDASLVERACKGAQCIMHVASIVDTTMFPNYDLSYKINVEGTKTILEACRRQGIQRLIYCSTMEVVCGDHSIVSGTEETCMPFEEGHNFGVYGKTKFLAEKMILEANAPSLRTASLRPVVMYGEEEWRSLPNALKTTQTTGMFVTIDCAGRAEHAYVGNVAWSFLCAESTLRANDQRSKDASGQAYFICDNTPPFSIFEFLMLILAECGVRKFPVTIPIWCLLSIFHVIWLVLYVTSLLYKPINFPYGTQPFRMMQLTITLNCQKAKRLLNYSPIVPFQEAKKRTVNFIKAIAKKQHTLKGA